MPTVLLGETADNEAALKLHRSSGGSGQKLMRSAVDVLLAESMTRVLGHLPAARDGDAEATHQARIEIRIAREAVSVAGAATTDRRFKELDRVLQELGRALGRVRDADVVHRLVHDLEQRFRLATSLLSRLGTQSAATQRRARRKMVRALEGLRVETLEPPFPRVRRHLFDMGGRRAAGPLLRGHIAERARSLRGAIEHAGGVHFAGRLHDTRIAVKRIRYALELVDRLSFSRPRGVRRILKRAQVTLGTLHDQDMLLERIEAFEDNLPPVADELEALTQFITAEANTAHRAYLSQRPELLMVCDLCDAAGSTGFARRTLATVGVAMPALLLFSATRRHQKHAEVDRVDRPRQHSPRLAHR